MSIDFDVPIWRNTQRSHETRRTALHFSRPVKVATVSFSCHCLGLETFRPDQAALENRTVRKRVLDVLIFYIHAKLPYTVFPKRLGNGSIDILI